MANRAVGIGTDIEFEDFRWNPECGTSVRDIYDTADMTLNWCRAENRVGLRLGIAELGEVFDGIKAGLAIGDMDIEIVLLAPFIYGNAFKNKVVVVGRGDGTGFEDRVFDPVFGNAALDDLDSEVQPAGHFDGAAEGDFAVTLAEVEVSHGEPAAIDINWKIDARASREVFNVAISAMFTGRDGARTLGSGLVAVFALESAHVGSRSAWRACERGNTVWVGRNQTGFTGIPSFEKLLVRKAAYEARVDQAGIFHTWNMA